MSYTKFAFLVLFAFFYSCRAASALDVSNYCLVKIPIRELSGIAQQEKWRAISEITVFPNSEHALFFSFNGHSVMRLDGYELVPVPFEELPYNALSTKKFFYGPDQRIYATAWAKEQKTFFMRNSKTGKFTPVPKSENAELEPLLTPVWDNRHFIGSDLKKIEFNHGDGKVYLNGEEIPAIYEGQFETGHMNLAHLYYSSELKEIFATGFLYKPHDYFPFIKKKEFGTFRWENDRWIKLQHPETKDFFFHASGYSSILNTLVITGSETQQRYTGVEQDFSNIYLFGNDKKLMLVKGTSQIPMTRVYDLKKFNKVILLGRHSLYELKGEETVNEIKLPFSLEGEWLWDLVEMPASNAAALVTTNGIYLIDDNLNLTDNPVFDISIFKRISAYDVKYIPVRNELFIQSSNGPFMLIDKKISKDVLCDYK